MKASPSSTLRKIISRVQGTPATPATPAQAPQVMIATAPAPALDTDRYAEARTRLLRNHRDGSALVALLDRMIIKAPAIAAQTIMACTLGRETERQAAVTLREYGRTKTAVAPLVTL